MFFEFFKFFAILLSPILITIFIILISFLCFHLYYYLKGYRMKKKDFKYIKDSIIKRLFIQFPNRLSLDLYNRDPYEFNEYGLHMFCGEQGSGKTTAIVHKLIDLKKQYPKCKIRTNMNYTKQDGEIDHWQTLVSNDNGEYGQVEVIDEIQTWFSSLQSKDFPPEMITEISQQRKQRKMLIGSAQVFSRIAKPIREQTTFVYLPFTFLGCLTVVRVSKPRYWNDEEQRFTRYIKTYFFVHTEEIRNSFDTYLKIEKYNKTGFKTETEQSVLREPSNTNINMFLTQKRKK